MTYDIIENEKKFHDKRFDGNDGNRKGARKFYSINYLITNRYKDIVKQYSKGKKLLEYGCGTGSSSIKWLESGAILTGIDISEEGIKKAIENISKAPYTAEYFVMNAEETKFEDNSFDVVVGSGIIHHLNLKKSFKEISRILNNKGHAVFIEPLGHNPFINLYRLLTPKMRTTDEHPLTMKDIKLINDYFDKIEIEYFFIFTLLAVPFRNMSIFNSICKFLTKIDDILFKIPLFRKYAWSVIIHCSKENSKL